MPDVSPAEKADAETAVPMRTLHLPPQLLKEVTNNVNAKAYEVPSSASIFPTKDVPKPAVTSNSANTVWLADSGNYVSNRQIEAARIAMTRYMKRGGKVWIRIFPHLARTKKPLEVRMGSGKGAPEGWVAVVKPGRVNVRSWRRTGRSSSRGAPPGQPTSFQLKLVLLRKEKLNSHEGK